MKDVFAKRLKSARTLACLSQDELVKCIEGLVSKNAIAKYVRGEMMADGKVLIALANALNVKPDYFFRPFTVEIENIEFRKKSKLVTEIVERLPGSRAVFKYWIRFLQSHCKPGNLNQSGCRKSGQQAVKSMEDRF